MPVLGDVLRHMKFHPPTWMPTNERPILRMSSNESIRLESFRVNRDGDMIRSTWRSAEVQCELPDYMWIDRSAIVGTIHGRIEYLSRQLFPRPSPRFRIRRDAKRVSYSSRCKEADQVTYEETQTDQLERLRTMLGELSSAQSVAVCRLVLDMVDLAYREGSNSK